MTSEGSFCPVKVRRSFKGSSGVLQMGKRFFTMQRTFVITKNLCDAKKFTKNH